MPTTDFFYPELIKPQYRSMYRGFFYFIGNSFEFPMKSKRYFIMIFVFQPSSFAFAALIFSFNSRALFLILALSLDMRSASTILSEVL